MRPRLSVVLLCHNELVNLPATLTELEGALAPLGAVEVVVVDDGSTDGTAEWLATRMGTFPTRLARHDRRRGYGRAVRTGFEAATGDRIAYVDGDGQFELTQLLELMTLMDAGWDIVAGYRRDRSDPPHRLLIGAVYNAAMRQITGARFRDFDCGCKLLSRTAVTALSLRCDGNLVGAELMSKAARAGLRITQVPVIHRPRRRGRPKGADAFAIWHSLRELYAHWDDLRPAAESVYNPGT